MVIANFIVLYVTSNTGDANIVEGSACDDRMDKSSKFFSCHKNYSMRIN